MKIKKVIIYGYGKWIDTEFTINEDWHIFYGQNEAGKSTLMSFIHSILFGFPKRHSSALRYEPKESSRYGGKLIIEDERFGEVIIERVSGKVTGDVLLTLEDGTQGGDEILETLLYNKKRQFYESIYTFNLKGIEETRNMTKEQLNRFFLSAGTLGSEQYLKLADIYQEKAANLFKPTGRKPVINQLYTRLSDIGKKVESARERNIEYTSLREKSDSYLKQIEDLSAQVKLLEEEKEKYISVLKHGKILKEINQLKNEIESFHSLKVPENGKIQLRHYNEQLENTKDLIKEKQDQQSDLQKEYKPSTDFILSQEEGTAYHKLKNNLDRLEDQVEIISKSQHELTTIEHRLIELKLREGYSLKESLPKELTENKRGELRNFKNKQAELEEKEKGVQSTVQELKIRTESNNERIDALEKNMWSGEVYKEKIEKKADKPLESNSFIKNRAFIAGIIFLTTGIISATVIQNLLGLTILLLLSSAVLYFNRHFFFKDGDSKITEEENEALYYQKNLKVQWKELLATNDNLQDKMHEQESSLDDIRSKLKENQIDFEKWKEKMGYPQWYTLEKVITTQELFKEMNQLSNKKDSLEQRLLDYTNRLDQELLENNYVKRVVSEEQKNIAAFYEVRNKIRAVEKEKSRQKDYIQKTNSLQESIRYLIKQEKNVLNKKYQLFSESGIEHEEEFLKLYELANEKREKQKRYQFLKETIEHQSILKDNYTIEEVNEQIGLLEEKIETKKDKITKKTKERIEIDYQTKQLEEGGTYSELLQQYENEKSVYQKAADEWCMYKVAASLIEQTLKYAKDNQLPNTIKLAETYLSHLTDGEYQTITFESDHFSVTDNKGRSWNAEELSRGTVEPLYIAIRLAFVYSSRETIRFPIIIDDSFVNMDRERRKRVYELLESISKEVQVIYFSFDSSISESISSKRITRLMK